MSTFLNANCLFLLFSVRISSPNYKINQPTFRIAQLDDAAAKLPLHFYHCCYQLVLQVEEIQFFKLSLRYCLYSTMILFLRKILYTPQILWTNLVYYFIVHKVHLKNDSIQPYFTRVIYLINAFYTRKQKCPLYLTLNQ